MKTDDSGSIFTDNSPYGYLLDITHPQIAPLYWRFKAWKGIPRNMPMSDAERFEFESTILNSKKENFDEGESSPDHL